ncbi:MAG: tRNA epoxyqueuosine(34) reductase QueG [Pseudomonadota bacterium]|nr:tRNA epoxyqueuosine(34) reductase QueG [Pseudomonadota bacterium]
MMTSISEPDGLRRALEQRAVEEGFVALGIADPRAMRPAGDRLRHFIDSGRHGEMGWLADRVDWRADPRALWPEVRSVIMLQASYAPDRDPLEGLRETGQGLVSAYAARRDYHDVVKGALKRLGQWLVHRAGGEIKVFTDTAPVMEKPLAALAGIGWQGKHTNLVSRTHGSWTFLGAIYTTLDLAPDTPATDHCGTCSRCLDICPTAAFPAPYQLDARRCIAYLTVEHRGQIPAEFRTAIGNRVFGCDDCLAVCPWNRFARAVRAGRLAEREDLSRAPLGALLALDDAAFRTRFAGTPVKRLGRDRFIRNVLVAAGNSGDTNLAPAVERLLSDPSPLVRGMAVWALYRLDPDRADACRRKFHAVENDPGVRTEWAGQSPA